MRCAVVLILLALASGARGQVWPTTTWDALCVEGGAGGVWNATPDAHVPPTETPTPCVGDFDTVGSFVEQDLGAASAWLQGLGFGAPLENRRGVGNPYIFFVGADEVRSGGAVVEGVYRVYDGGLLVVGSQLLRTDNAGNQTSKGTAVHEMAHAVQASTPFWAAQSAANDQTWIKEGTAQAIEAEWARRQYGEGGLGPDGYVRRFSLHAFDRSLHLPVPGSDDAYSAAQFWLGVGEILGSPDRIGYLRDVFASPSTGDNGVSGVDAALKQHHPEGLYYLYPEFIARWTADLGDSPQFNRAPEAVEVRSLGVKRFESPAVVPPLASFPVEVDVTPPGPNVYRLTIEIENGGEGLHLIVGDQVITSGTYTHNLSEPLVGLNVRVANVAPEAAATAPERFTLLLTLEEAGCGASGPYAASFSVSDTGPAIGGGHSLTVPLAPEAEEVMGVTQDYYHGLTVTKSSFMGLSVSWSQAAADESRRGLEQSRAMIRDMGWEGKSASEVRRLMSGLDRDVLARYFEEEESDTDAGFVTIGDVLGQAITVSMPLEGESGPFSASFLDNERGASVMLGIFAAGGIQPGIYTHEQGANVGIQAPAFASGGMAEGIQLYQPTITITDVDPGGCVMGTFQGPYAGPDRERHEITGSFSVTVPPDATVVEF